MQTRGMGKGLLLGAILFLAMSPLIGYSAVPSTINYQGYLTNSAGAPINATVQIAFSLYSGASGGSALWTETQNVVVASGYYSVNLGAVNPITLPFDVPYYLGVKVGSDPEMTPRQPLTSVPYAFRARTAENTGTGTITGVTAGTGLTGGGTSGNVTLSVGTPYQLPQGCASGKIPSWSGSAWVCATDQNSGGTITGVTAGNGLTGGGTSGSVTLSASFGGSGGANTVSRSDHSHSAGDITSGTLDNARFSAYSDLTAEGYLGNAKDSDILTRIQADGRYVNVGEGSSITSNMIVPPLSLSGSASTAGVISGSNTETYGYGVYGSAPGTHGTGVRGVASATGNIYNYGGSFEADGGAGIGVYGYAAATGNVTNYGGYFAASGTSGAGVYGYGSTGVYGESHKNDPQSYAGLFVTSGNYGTGVRGVANARGSFNNYGGTFEANGDGGKGVYAVANGAYGTGVDGFAFASGDVTNYGGHFVANGNTGYGVFADCLSTSGTGVWGRGYNGIYGVSYPSPNGNGVVGEANNGGSAYGVWGKSTSGYAGYFTGPVYVTGNLGAGGTKPFKIDHPLDPANKYLMHYAVESPTVQNMYNGTILLDAYGEAVVQLPDYFEAENAEPFTYTLTPVGASMPSLYVVEEVQGNQFKISGGVAGKKVSWVVIGQRNDAWLQQHPAPVEELKKPEEQGYYIHPELYGHPEEKSIEWARRPEMMKKIKEEREKAKRSNGE